MLKTVEATIDANGQVKLIEHIVLNGTHRALVTILEEDRGQDAAILAESSLQDWRSPEEDAAWAHLNLLPSIGEVK